MTDISDTSPLLYVAMGDGFARLEKDGRCWTVSWSLQDQSVQCLAIDPQDRLIVYAGTHGNGIWKSRDGGRRWRPLAGPKPDVFSIAVSAVDGALYVGTEPSQLYVSRDGGEIWRELTALRELPSAPDWSFPPRSWTSHVRSIAPCLYDAEHLLVGILLGGLMLSEDGGKIWAEHRSGAQRDVHAFACHPAVPGRAYEAGGGRAAWSRDGGLKACRCWTQARLLLGMAVHPADPDIWYVSAVSGPHAAHDGDRNAEAVIYRWRGDGPWQPVTDVLDSLPYAITCTGDCFYAGFGDCRIVVSNGDSWHHMEVKGDRIDQVQALVSV